METIKNYLENLFAGYPKTEEILNAKAELSSNMEDKYNELKAEGKSENEAIGIVISEFGNIDELAAEWSLPVNASNGSISVNREEAESFIEAKKKNGMWVGIGVALCFAGIILMIIVGCMVPGMENNRLDITDPTSFESVLDVLTLLPLLVFVAMAVAVFIISGARMDRYKSFEKNLITLSASTRAYVETCKNRFQTAYTIMITLGVVLCILVAPVTLISISLLGESDPISAAAVTVMLFFIAVAVYLFIRSGEEMSAYKQLLQEDDYSPANKKSNKTMEIIGSIYWPVAAVIYLVWSFLTMDWHITWIVWLVAGILYGAIAAVFALINSSAHSSQ